MTSQIAHAAAQKLAKVSSSLWLPIAVAAIALLHLTRGGTLNTVLIDSIQILLGVISFRIYAVSKGKLSRWAFLALGIFLSSAFLFSIYDIARQNLKQISPYGPHYFLEYSNVIFYAFLLFTITAFVFETVFRRWKLHWRVVGSVILTAGVIAGYFGSAFIDPLYLYKVPAYQDSKVIYQAWQQLSTQAGKSTNITAEQIASAIDLPVRKDGKIIGYLTPEAKLQRVKELLPYNEGANYLVLLFRPFYISIINVNIVVVLLIFFYLGYQYKRDPPQGAYIDKLMLLFLFYSTLEILHALGYAMSVEWAELVDAFSVGQYFTILVLILMGFVLRARLRFVSSIAGEFYESELVHDAERITRWRDRFDRVALHYFVNAEKMARRLFAQKGDAQ